ncbi:MAG: glycogen synthase, partial [Candidatus Helarchaeota archaeon]
LDLIEAIFDEFMKLNLQFILLGTGLEKYHKFFSKMAKKYPKKTAIFLKFDNELAHKIEAGADFFLMPSKYEPCGLNQLISLRYGTIPIVRFTGGLADSITDIRTSPEGKGVGFVFQNYEPQELFQIVKEALNFYKDKRQRIEVMKRAMQKDFSWQVSAEKYEQLYQMVIKKS